MNDRDAANIIAYAILGGKVQCCRKGCMDWKPFDTSSGKSDWDFQHFLYREKPKPREWWVVLDNDGKPEMVLNSRPDSIRNEFRTAVLAREVLD